MSGSPEQSPGQLRALAAALLGAVWAWLAMAVVLVGLALLITGAWAAERGAGDAGGAAGIGRALSAAEIAALDRDARYDGDGLPPGEGRVAQGEAIYAERCAACHGEFAEGMGRMPALLGGEGTLATDAPRRTIGSFWPHAPILFDYIYRAMPEGHAFSLTPEEVYALTAFLLNVNGIVEDDFTASASSLPKVNMPNREGFTLPPHPRAEGTRCMQDCRKPPRIAAEAPARVEGVMIGEEEQKP